MNVDVLQVTVSHANTYLHYYILLSTKCLLVSIKHVYTSKRQIWHATVTKKGEKIHPPDKIRKILFDRPHLENEEGYKRPKRFLLDPRPVHDRETTIDWNQLSVASEGNASVLCFKNFNDSFVDHNYQPSLVTQELQPLTVRNIASEAQNINMFYSILFKNRTKDFITDIRKLTFGQSSNNLWFDYRYGVITASVAHDVLLKCSRLRTSSVNSLVARILQYSKPVRAASLAWGVENESFARKRYIKQNRRTHKHFQCKESGLMLHLKKPMFGASVDGYVISAVDLVAWKLNAPSHTEKKVSGNMSNNQILLS